MANRALLKEVRRAIGSDPRADLRPIRIDIAADGTLTLEGEVPNAAVKRLALRRAGAVGGVAAVVDRLRVRPAQRKGDGEIRDHVCNALAQEPGLLGCEIRFRAGERVETVPGAPGNGRGVPPEWLGQRARGQASGRRARVVGAGQPRREQRPRGRASGGG